MSYLQLRSILPVLPLVSLMPLTLQQCGGDSDDGCPACVADFALYDPGYEDDGVWEEEVTALEAMFETYGWSYGAIGPQDLNVGTLGQVHLAGVWG